MTFTQLMAETGLGTMIIGAITVAVIALGIYALDQESKK